MKKAFYIVFVVVGYIAIVWLFVWMFGSVFTSDARGEGNAPINYGTYTHVVKKPPTTTFTVCDFDFTGLNVCGLATGGGSGTLTNFSAGDLSPLFTTDVATPTLTPLLTFSPVAVAAHTYYGNNTGGTEVPAFHVIDFSELSGTPTPAPSYTFIDSIVNTSGTVSLVNDAATPGNSKYYGTDSGGTRGYFTLPTGITTFLGLTDTPDSYVGHGNELVSVKNDETGLEFISVPSVSQSHDVTFVVDGSGGVLTAGTKHPIKIPYSGTLQGWLLIASPSGSVTVDVFRAANGAGLPVTSIIGPGTKPALSSAVENSSATFPSWTSTTLTAKDNLAISLSGISAVTYCALTLYYQ